MLRSPARLLLLGALALALAGCSDSSSSPDPDGSPGLSDGDAGQSVPADAAIVDDEGPAPDPADAAADSTEPTDAPAVTDADASAPPAPLDWAVVADGFPPGALLSVWAGAADDVWFVGGELQSPLVLHLGPAGWEEHDPGTGQQAWWVHGFDDGTRVVVGDGGSIARFDGEAWTDESAHIAGATLYGVWGDAPDHLWAVGGPFLQAAATGATPVQGDILLRYGAGQWHSYPVPELDSDRAGQSLFKVWGAADDDVYVVGSGGLILHWDGAAWTPEPVAGLDSVTLFTVTGRGPDDVWAVGGGPRAVLLHRDADGWAEVELPEFAPQILQGVWTAPGQPVYVAGTYGFTARLDPGGWHLPDPGTSQALHAVRGDPGGGLWAAGGTIMTLSPHYDGTLLVAGRDAPALDLTPPDPEPAPDASDGGPTPDAVADSSEEVLADVLEPTDVGPDPLDVADSSEPPPCGAGATECPAQGEQRPYPGAPCVGPLTCDYENGTYSVDHFECVDGVWSWWTECFVPGCSALPPFAEMCSEPFDGHLTGELAVALGPAIDGAPFVPFEPGELLPVEWGPQGMPMVGLRVGLTGAEELDCIQVSLAAELAGVEMKSSMALVAHCGATLRMYLILPVSPLDCAVGETFELTLVAKVAGVATGAATVTVEGGGAWWCQ